MSGDAPVVGDWGNGVLRMAVFRNGYWYADSNGNQSWDSGTDAIINWGGAGDIPVVGDWNHTGQLRIGVYGAIGSYGYWYVNLHSCSDYYGCNWGGPNGNLPEVQGQDYDVYQFGLSTDLPVVGDWDHSGMLRIGLFRPV